MAQMFYDWANTGLDALVGAFEREESGRTSAGLGSSLSILSTAGIGTPVVRYIPFTCMT